LVWSLGLRLDEVAHPAAHCGFDRIKPVVESCVDVSAASVAESGCVVGFVMS
jgi:hypothetical protein